MITCPLCNTEVQNTVDQKPVPDDSANDYRCPTLIKINPNKAARMYNLQCHFSRRQLRRLINGQAAYVYQAIILPFQVCWTTNSKVSVFKIDNKGNREDDGKAYYQSKNIGGYNDFLKTCKRFKVLVPFS